MTVLPPSQDLADLFNRHERVFLAFSGGKDSLVVAHLCEPWRDQVTLLWTNTGYMAPHMVRWVRSFGERFALKELVLPHDLLDYWATEGAPAEVLPMSSALGRTQPKLQGWPLCCFVNRHLPILNFMNEFASGAALLHGQRRSDRGANPENVPRQMPTVEVGWPIWEWSDADVWAYIEDKGIPLPEHYAELPNSLECVVCPVPATAQRLAYIRRHFPGTAPLVEATVRLALDASAEAMVGMREGLASALA